MLNLRDLFSYDVSRRIGREQVQGKQTRKCFIELGKLGHCVSSRKLETYPQVKELIF